MKIYTNKHLLPFIKLIVYHWSQNINENFVHKGLKYYSFCHDNWLLRKRNYF